MAGRMGGMQRSRVTMGVTVLWLGQGSDGGGATTLSADVCTRRVLTVAHQAREITAAGMRR